MKTVLEFRDVGKSFKIKKTLLESANLQALSGVSFSLYEGQSLGIVGESGSGKSTMAKILLKMEEASSGGVFLDNKEMREWAPKELAKRVQMVFQNPLSSLSPRKTIVKLIEEPLIIQGTTTSAERRKMALELMDKVGLRPDWEGRYPHELSGGQRQRVAIARALALRPSVLVCDEPVSALDVSVQAQVLNLLKDLQAEYKWTLIFISHDLHVVRWLCSDILVLYLGAVMEKGKAAQVFSKPQHPYTKALLSSVPSVMKGRASTESSLQGEIPSPFSRPQGCVFQTRCPHKMDICERQMPPHRNLPGQQDWFCHLEPHSV